MIQNLCIVDWFNIITTVCNCRIRCTKFYVRYTMCQTTERKWKVRICPDRSIGISVRFCSMSQCCKSKIIQILQAKLWSNLLQTFYCHNVNGILNCLSDRRCSTITLGSIVDRRSIRIVVRFIFKRCCKCHSLLIEGWCIRRKNLKCRTRLSGRICCSVQSQTGCLFSTTANDGLNVARMLVNNTH